ncbi:SEC-C metal-binding domain-containing protein [Aeribacillus alveayuensis]|uniref:Tetratricopeptide (TPR) repeat protein n=1 Tax=Aeribacillus alveayuensis TaxID=279215 RepID=A0ABT9VSR1_9BACI|nr:tetratricopeptide (TPR) repeat protein [Bacillus alveayuensis]
MTKVKRNDPCPCGSGKKYKRCCGNTSFISIQQILKQEIVNLQKDIIEFSLMNYDEEILTLVEDYLEGYNIPGEMEEIYQLMGVSLAIFTQLVDGEKTPLQLYIDRHLHNIQRPKMKEILQSWVGVKPSATEVLSVDNERVVVKDILTKETKNVIIFEEDCGLVEGALLIGILVPIGESFTFFAMFVDFYEEKAERIRQTIIEHFDNSEVSPQEFMASEFLDILDQAFFITLTFDLIENFSWSDPQYKEVAKCFQLNIKNEENSDTLVLLGVTLWYKYCELKQPRIKNIGLYAACIHYVVYRNIPFLNRKKTLNELAEMYGANPGSISQRAHHVESVVEDFLQQAKAASLLDGAVDFALDEGTPFEKNRFLMERSLLESERKLENVDIDSMEDLNEYLNDPTIPSRPLTKQEQAQELIFDAYGESGRKRKQLINKALKLDPNNPDAYNLLAEEASSFEEALNLYREGMIRGEKSLGKAFIEENKGHFWGIVKTRPYMRAKFHYSCMLYEDGQLQEAIQHFEEL